MLHLHLYLCMASVCQSTVGSPTLVAKHAFAQLCRSLLRGAWLPLQAVVSFTWDSAGRTLSYPYEEFMAECGGLSDHLAALIRRLLHIKLVIIFYKPLTCMLMRQGS